MKKIYFIFLCLLLSFQTANANIGLSKVEGIQLGVPSFNLSSKGTLIKIRFNFPVVKTNGDLKTNSSFIIGLDGNLEKGDLHAVRSGAGSFYISDEFRNGGQPYSFYLSSRPINLGEFENLYSYLGQDARIKLENGCSYLNDGGVVEAMMNLLIEKYPQWEGFLSDPSVREDASSLFKLCAENSKKVYIKDVQNTLNALGYNPGPVDGKWGNKTRIALQALFRDNDLVWEGKLTSNVFRKLRKPLGLEGEKLIGGDADDQYFDYEGRLDNVPKKLNQSTKITTVTHGLQADFTKKIQFCLIALNYLKGKIDGINGPKVKAAITEYLASNNKKTDDISNSDLLQYLTKDLAKLGNKEIRINILANLKWTDMKKAKLSKILAPQEELSSKDFSGLEQNGFIFLIGKKIKIDSNQSFSGKTKVIILDSLISSGSRYRNEYNINFYSDSSLIVINSASASPKNAEAFNFTFSGSSSVLHINFKHSLSSPWQVAKNHRGHIQFLGSTCNVTLLKQSRNSLECENSDRLMIEPILPNGRFTVSLPSHQQVKTWESDASLPWKISIKNSYVEHIDFAVGPGVNLTVENTKNFSGGWPMCCKGSGKISGLVSGKTFKNATWSISSEQGRATLTLVNSSLGGMWPSAWGNYNFTIENSDLIDPSVGAQARMTIKNSSFDLIMVQDNAIVTISDSKLINPNDESKKISAKDASRITLINVKGVKKRHVFESGSGRVIFK